MQQQPLPLIDSVRIEFGFARTVCACAECVRNCLHMPGYLVPADLVRIQQHLAADKDLLLWARDSLLASPGAVVAQQGRAFRIPTLVPAQRPGSGCLFLTAEQRCRIHAVAPFGCAFFDVHQAAEEADRRSIRGLQAVLQAWQRCDLYAQVWVALHEAGLVAPAPEVARRRLRQTCAENKPP